MSGIELQEKLNDESFPLPIVMISGHASVQNAVEVEVSDSASVDTVISDFNLPLDLVHLVILNGVYVAPEARGQVMSEGDTLAIWPPVAGG